MTRPPDARVPEAGVQSAEHPLCLGRDSRGLENTKLQLTFHFLAEVVASRVSWVSPGNGQHVWTMQEPWGGRRWTERVLSGKVAVGGEFLKYLSPFSGADFIFPEGLC